MFSVGVNRTASGKPLVDDIDQLPSPRQVLAELSKGSSLDRTGAFSCRILDAEIGAADRPHPISRNQWASLCPGRARTCV
jgi:hypothetical protein